MGKRKKKLILVFSTWLLFELPENYFYSRQFVQQTSVHYCIGYSLRVIICLGDFYFSYTFIDRTLLHRPALPDTGKSQTPNPPASVSWIARSINLHQQTWLEILLSPWRWKKTKAQQGDVICPKPHISKWEGEPHPQGVSFQILAISGTLCRLLPM